MQSSLRGLDSCCQSSSPKPSIQPWAITHKGDRQLLSSLVLTASSALSELPTYGPEQLTEMSDLPATSAQGEASHPSDLLTNTVEGLGVAAEVLGEKARGPVAMSIRAKAVSRLATASALRQLVHLHGKADSEPEEGEEQEPAGPLTSQSEHSQAHSADVEVKRRMARQSTSRQSMSSQGTRRLSTRASLLQMTYDQGLSAKESLAAMLSSAEKSCKLSSKIHNKKYREVASNTTLGKIVGSGPARAARKFNLIVVPAWCMNKPWPPPPVKARYGKMRFNIDDIRMKIVEEDVEVPMDSQPSRKLTMTFEKHFSRRFSSTLGDESDRRVEAKTLSMSSDLSTGRKRSESKKKKSKEDRRQALKQIEDTVDYAVKLMNISAGRKEGLADSFYKHSERTAGLLRSEGLRKALAEAGIKPTTLRERERVREVQEVIINKFRSEEDDHEVDGIKNPLKDRRGAWRLVEFLAMAATCRELARQDELQVEQALADQHGCELATVHDLHQVYEEMRKQETMVLQDFVCILEKLGLPRPPDKDLAMLLDVPLAAGNSLSPQRKIPFAMFLPAMLKVQGILEEDAENGEFDIDDGDNADVAA